MKILDIIPYVPYPLDSGGNQAVFNMLESMVEKHEVHLLLKVNSSKNLINIDKLHDRLPSLVIHVCDERPKVQEPAPKASLDSKIKYTLTMKFFDYLQKSMKRKIERRKNKQLNRIVAAELSTPHTAEIAKEESEVLDVACDLVRANTTLYNYLPEYSSKYIQFVYETSRIGFDVIQCEFFETIELGRVLPKDIKKVFVHHELRYIRNRNEMELLGSISPMDIFTYRKFKEEELSALRNFDVIVVLTNTDKHLLLHENPNLNILVSPAIVKYESSPLPFVPVGEDMVFVGSGDHFPNYDGLLWYCKNVAPLLRQAGKEPKLYVTGVWREEKREIILSTGANVFFVGFVDDLHSFVNGKLSIVPIRIGSGMRMKILDAVDSASPIVSTSKGCEGLDFEDGIDIIISDSGESFAKSILRILGDEPFQRSLSDSSKDKLSKVFSPFEQVKTRLEIYN